MKRMHRLLFAVACIASCAIAASASANSFVRLDFNVPMDARQRSTVFIELFDDRPLTSANFLAYVDGGKYDGTLLHRLVHGFVLQGGGFYPEIVDEPAPLDFGVNAERVDLDGNPSTPNPSITNEFGLPPTRSNVRGTIAMAKLGGLPDSATNQFFFNLTNNSANLDNQNGGFTVFAQVLDDGMNYIDYVSAFGTRNVNPDNATYIGNTQISTNPDGIRDPGAFDSAPLYGYREILTLDRAKSVTYHSSTSTTSLPGTTSFNGEHFVEAGATFSGNGTVDIRPGARFALDHGASVNVKVVNEGVFDPGLRVGSVSVARFSQAAAGTTKLDLGGTTAGLGYDQINSSTAAVLNGVLDIDLVEGFTPTAGNAFTLITADDVSGHFSALDLPSLPAGLVWGVHYNTTNVVLTVAAGDFDRNGVVDAADYAVWRDTLGSSVAAYSGADGNGDGIISADDYSVWKNSFNWINSSTASDASGSGSLTPGAVPEPASLVLLLAGALLASAKRRRSTV